MDEGIVSSWAARRDEALADGAWKQAVQSTAKARADALVGLRDLLDRFLRGAIDVEPFRSEFDRRSRQEWSTFGLGGFAGGMFLNKLAKHIPDQAQLAAQLRAAFAVPANEEEARDQLASFCAYLESLLAAGSVTRAQVDPPRVSVFVPFWWHVQAPEAWPVFFPSARKALAKTRAIPSESSDAAGYITFRRAFFELSAALRLGPLEMEQLCKRPPGGLSPAAEGDEPAVPARRSVWLIQPGPRARLWEDFVAHDVGPNRLLKAALGAVLRCREVHASLTARARALYAMLPEVAEPRLSEALIRGVRVPRAAPMYRLVRDVSGLLLRHALPDESGKGLSLRDFTRDDLEMAHLFEAFVRGFLRCEAVGWKVGATEVEWADTTAGPDARRLLPRMKTDVSMRAPGRQVILETKFVRQPFRMTGEAGGVEQWKLRSGHLYQLFAYLMNTHASRRSLRVEGKLVYASVGRGVRAAFAWGAVPVEVHTIDLAADWAAVSEQMRGLIPG